METKVQPMQWAVASALAVGVTWLICSAMVYLMPGPMLDISSDMVHLNLSQFSWHLSLSGVLMGLLGWMAMAALIGGLIPAILQKLSN